MTSMRYSHPENGYPKDREKARGYLKIGKVYAVTHTIVHPYHTEIFLKAFPKVSFNSVLFEEVGVKE